MLPDKRRTGMLSAAVIIAIVCMLRTVHIRADTPTGLSSDRGTTIQSSDHGTFVDEGYKTLAARNLFLFGSDRWHTADTYPGWWKASPLTQWSYYLSFVMFQPDIAAARTVTIMYYTLFLIIYVVFSYNCYPSWVFYGGLLLCGLESTLFFFSRIALFEIPMLTFVYALVMFFRRIPETEYYTAVVPALATAALVTFTVKQTALVYVSPVFVAIVIVLAYQRRASTLFAGYVVGLVCGVVILLALTYNTWSSRLDVGPYAYLFRVVVNPLVKVSPFMVLAGLFCALHGVVHQPAPYVTNLYRVTVMCLVILGPFALALFKLNPLRYYVPFVPAYLLMSLEWFALARARHESSELTMGRTALAIVLLLMFVSYCSVALGVEERINIRVPANGVIFGITIGIVVMMTWTLRRVVFSRTGSLAVVCSLLALGIIESVVRIGEFLGRPSVSAEQVRRELIEMVSANDIVAGDWAPFFALGTPIRAVYSNRDFNAPSVLWHIRPQYFLDSEATPYIRDNIRRFPNISLGSGRHVGTYNGCNLTLYHLSYTP